MEYGHASFSRIPCGLERRAMWVLSLISLHFVAIIFLCHISIDGVPLNGSMKFQRRHIDYIDDDSDDDYDDTSMCQLSNGIVANRNNCNQFYICGDDDRYPPTLGICPPGMWFDPVHTEVDDIVCIYPEVACTNPQLDMFKYCKCHELYPTGIVAANGHNNNTDALLEKSSQCIVDNQFHLYASAIDCERYFICFNGNVKRLQCKSGLHFNAANGHCDHPLTANCHLIDRQCPPTGITFLRHLDRCDAYYYCLNGEKLLQRCAFNEAWHSPTMKCVQRNTFANNC